jgi:hypothetical protein
MIIIHEQANTTNLNKTPHGTILTEFKRALVEFRKNGFTSDQGGDSDVVSICEWIDRLLNDDLMMKPGNDYTFEQITLLTQINLFKTCFKLMRKLIM